MNTRSIYCCECATDVDAVLTNGAKVYPHRPDLRDLPFWMCQGCKSFVGCHHKTKDRTRPLGCIPSEDVKDARKWIHALIDPAWQSGAISRRSLYAALGAAIGREYHTADIRSVEEARKVYRAARQIINARAVQ